MSDVQDIEQGLRQLITEIVDQRLNERLTIQKPKTITDDMIDKLATLGIKIHQYRGKWQIVAGASLNITGEPFATKEDALLYIINNHMVIKSND